MVQSLRSDEEEEASEHTTPITNIQKASALSKIVNEIFLKRKTKARISTMLCRQIFQSKLQMNKKMRESEKSSVNTKTRMLFST